MKKLFLFALVVSLFPASFAAAKIPDTIGGEKIITLRRYAVSKVRPEFASVTVLPGRGMQILYVTVNFPGKGEVPVLVSPDLATAAKQLDQQDSPWGDNGYMIGAAFLAPYANRIRGPVSEDGKSLTVTWNGHALTLPANRPARTPGSAPHAMHGLILKSHATDVHVTQSSGVRKVTGTIHAGDFGGHWLSSTDLEVTISLTPDAVSASIVAHNVGAEAEPMAIGWHPWLNLPSGDRAQARVQIPASTMTETAADGFPTGKVIPVAGTRFDFNQPDGRPLGTEFYDGNLNTLERKDGVIRVKVTDPAAHYGVGVDSSSPDIRTIQMASPAGKSVVAIEHQYNYLDPFGEEWGSADTGMVTLQPGQSTKWEVRLHVFVTE